MDLSIEDELDIESSILAEEREIERSIALSQGPPRKRPRIETKEEKRELVDSKDEKRELESDEPIPFPDEDDTKDVEDKRVEEKEFSGDVLGADRKLVLDAVTSVAFPSMLRSLYIEKASSYTKIGRTKRSGPYIVYPIPLGRGCALCHMQHRWLTIQISRKEMNVLAICKNDGTRLTKRLGILALQLDADAEDDRAVDQAEVKDVVDSKMKDILDYMDDPHIRRDDHYRYSRARWTDNDPYTYDLFLDEMTQFRARNENELIAFAANRWNRVIAFIAPSEYIVKKNLDDEKFFHVKALPSFKAMYMKRKKGKLVIMSMKHSDIVDKLMNAGLLTIYRQKAMKPARDCDAKTFNLWGGFQAEKDSIDTSAAPRGIKDRICEFIRRWICSGNTLAYDAFMKILVEIARHPGKKVPWATWIYSHEKRRGKTLLCDFLTDYVYGSSAVKKFNGLGEFNEKHNGWAIGKKLVIMEECSATKEEFKAVWDKIKGIVSDRKISINPKYVNQFDVNNYMSLFMVTNHRASLYLEADDRRYLCLEVSTPEDIDNPKEFLANLSHDILREDSGKVFFQYLLSTSEFDYVDPYNTDPPMTMVKDDIVADSQMPETCFIGELALHRVKYQLEELRDKIRDRVHATGLATLKVVNDPELGEGMSSVEVERVPEADYKGLDLKERQERRERFSALDDHIEHFRLVIRSLCLIGQVDLDSISSEERLSVQALQARIKNKVIAGSELYRAYSDWFRGRYTSIVKLAEKNLFLKRISQSISQTGRRQLLSRNLRVYDLDTIKPMYARVDRLADIRSLWEIYS